MSLSFEEALQKWARQTFEQRSVYIEALRGSARDGDTYAVQNTVIEYGGGCPTCSYDAPGFLITNTRTGLSIEWEGEFSEIVRELSQIGEEE